MSPDPDCFCYSKTHKRALVHLRYGLQQAEGFVVLTGIPGTGKTLLLHMLINELIKQNVVVAKVAPSMGDDRDLLPSILSAFQKPIFDYQLRSLIAQLEQYLLENAHSGQRSVIVIDEAQNLTTRSLEVLRLLSNLQYQNHAVLQIMLVGDKKLEETIARSELEPLRQRVALSYQLQPMQLSDTKNYIIHRLQFAGWQGDPSIDDTVFVRIHHLAKGVPGEINRVCDRLLMQGMLEEKHALQSEDVDTMLDQANLKVNSQVQKLEADSFIEGEQADSAFAKSAIEKSEVEALATELGARIAKIAAPTSQRDIASGKSTPRVQNVAKAPAAVTQVEQEELASDESEEYQPWISKDQIMTIIVSYGLSLVIAILMFYVLTIFSRGH